MDLNRQPPQLNTAVTIRLICRPKRTYEGTLVRTFGEAFYREVLASPLPFVHTQVFNPSRVLILVLF